MPRRAWPCSAQKDVEVVVDTKLAKDSAALKKALHDADGIAIRSGTQLTAEVLDGQPRLKAIVRAGVGVDNIDVPAATRQGIVVMNTPGGNTVSTAEHTMALMLSLARNVARANDSLKAGKWDRNAFTGTQLEGKTLGIVGLGRVGLAVAQRAQGFGMTVLGFDPLALGREGRSSTASRASRGSTSSGPGATSSPSTRRSRPRPATSSTPARSRQMKPAVRIINCARGGLIDEAGAGRGARRRQGGRRRGRRVRSRAAAGRLARDQAPPDRGHAAPGRLDRGGPGVGRRSRRRGS